MNTPSSIKLVSLNIEEDKHIPSVLSFLKQEQPEVLCLQEVHLEDFEMFKKELGMEGEHGPMMHKPKGENGGSLSPYGIGLLSKYPLSGLQKNYYDGSADSIPVAFEENPDREYGLLLWGALQKEGTPFTVGTTHFTWTPNGQADKRQRLHLDRLLGTLKELPDIVFCGDFNAPRGREIFSRISQHYTDHIPKEYTTSIDKDVHRKGDLRLMVDGLFATPHYEAKNVRLVKAGSDHLAITAEIRKT